MSASQPRITFGEKAVADSFREEHAEHLADADDARKRTLVLEAGTPEPVVESVEAAARGSRADRGGGFGQVPLTNESDAVEGNLSCP